MHNNELYGLLRNSRLAQVATPLSKKLRGESYIPTHQIIYTPKSSAIRSSFGIKTQLPKQVGQSHIVFNDIDNPKNMPDVEKYSGKYYNRLKFQETGMVVKNFQNESNPLFPSSTTKSTTSYKVDSILASFNLNDNATTADVTRLLSRNPELNKRFQQWLLKNSPRLLLSKPLRYSDLLRKFLSSQSDIVRQELQLNDLARPYGKATSNAPRTKIQGTGGFSYAQKGRLTNSPNGVKYGVIAPGRMVGDREAAIGGFVASVNDRTTLLQHNYSRNFPGKHSRQFVMPFKLNEVEITGNGSVKMYADGVKVGSWMQRTNAGEYGDRNYEASNPNFASASMRNRNENVKLETLLNLMGAGKTK